MDGQSGSRALGAASDLVELLRLAQGSTERLAQEIYGAVKGVNPKTGFNYDDTKRYIDSIEWLEPAAREKIFHGNVRKVYARYAKRAA